MADQTNQPTPSPHRIESTGGDQEPRVAGMTKSEFADYVIGEVRDFIRSCECGGDTPCAGICCDDAQILCDEVERLRSGGVVALDTHQRVVGERDAEIARLKAELTNLGYRYEDALAELARERDRD